MVTVKIIDKGEVKYYRTDAMIVYLNKARGITDTLEEFLACLKEWGYEIEPVVASISVTFE